MRDRYWDFYAQTKFSVRYLELYRQRCVILDKVFIFAGLALSTGGLAAFFTQMGLSAVGVALILLGQLAALAGHLLPYAQRTQALSYALVELPHLLDRIDADWTRSELGTFSDVDMAARLFEHEAAYTEIDSRFLGGITWPRDPIAAKKALAETRMFFETRFDLA
jgi:hypothetical protein